MWNSMKIQDMEKKKRVGKQCGIFKEKERTEKLGAQVNKSD